MPVRIVPTFLQMSSGASAAVSGLLLLPMMAGLIGTSILSGNLITKTGRYKVFPIVGTVLTGIAMVLFSTLTADTPLWLICVFLFLFGAGLGLIMQVVVLVVQNSVDAANVGTATSTNNYFREVGAALGVAIFGALFTSRLTDNLTSVFAGAGASPEDASQATATLDPATLNQLPEAVRRLVVEGYADALAPVFAYLVPFIVVALVLAVFLPQIALSDVAGMVARGEALSGDEAEQLETEQRAGAGGRGRGRRGDATAADPTSAASPVAEGATAAAVATGAPATAVDPRGDDAADPRGAERDAGGTTRAPRDGDGASRG